MSVNTALVRFVYPSRMQGRGFGHNALVVATAFTLGPTIASGILAFGPWPWLFAVNIPFGLVALGIGFARHCRRRRAPIHAFDFPGAALAAGAALACSSSGIGSAAHKTSLAWSSASSWSRRCCLACFLMRRQADHPAPMLPIDLFRRPMFALSAATAVCAFVVQGLAFVSLPFYFEDVLRRSQVETGFFMTPWPLVVAIMAPIGGRLSDRYPVGILGGIGLRPARHRHGAAGDASGLARRRRYRLADGDLRHRVRLLPDAEHEGADVERAAASQRQRERHRGDRAADRTDHRRGARRALLCARRSRRRNLALALGAGFAALGGVMSFLRLAVGSSRCT